MPAGDGWAFVVDVTEGIPAVPELLRNGWAMVAPDYAGMATTGPTPYLIGTGRLLGAGRRPARDARDPPGQSPDRRQVDDLDPDRHDG